MKNSGSKSHILWFELLNQKGMKNLSKNSSSYSKPNENCKSETYNLDLGKSINKKIVNYKSPEDYYDEIISFKRNIVTLKGEIELLKSKLRMSDEKLHFKDKELKEVINCFENQKGIHEMSVNNFIMMKKLHQNIYQLKSQVKCKETEIQNIKNEIKYTKLEELKIQNEIYVQEIRSLQQIISNFRTNESNDEYIVKPPKSSSVDEKYKLILKKNKDLLNENKLFKKEKEKLEQEELRNIETKEKPIGKSSGKEIQYLSEIKRLKTQYTELYDEKNIIQTKFENMSSRHKLLQDQYQNKLSEYESLKGKFDQRKHEKILPSIKTEEIQNNPDNSVILKEYDLEKKFIQTVLLAYSNREAIRQDQSKEKYFNDSEDIVVNCLFGYILREQRLIK